MKRVIFISVLFTLISMCSFGQGDFIPLNPYQIMDIHFKILNSDSKDSLVERADTILPKGSYDQRIVWDFDGKSVGYNLVIGCQINVNEMIGDGLIPAVDFRVKESSFNTERQVFLLEEFLNYLKEKKGYKGKNMSTLNTAKHKKTIFLWKGGFSTAEVKDDGFTSEMIFTNYYDMSKQKKK